MASTKSPVENRAPHIAAVLFECDQGASYDDLAKRHNVSARSVKRWRARERAGELPEVSAELERLRDDARDEVRAKAEQVLEGVMGFLSRACAKGDPQDPAMIQAIVKAGEFLVDTIATQRLMASRVQGIREDPALRAQAGEVGADTGEPASVH